jgi:hypothetical protein
MNVTKDIISDLFPIYVSNECSADTRALVDEYLKSNPREAEELRRIMSSPVTGPSPRSGSDGRARSVKLAAASDAALFSSASPFSSRWRRSRSSIPRGIPAGSSSNRRRAR